MFFWCFPLRPQGNIDNISFRTNNTGRMCLVLKQKTERLPPRQFRMLFTRGHAAERRRTMSLAIQSDIWHGQTYCERVRKLCLTPIATHFDWSRGYGQLNGLPPLTSFLHHTTTMVTCQQNIIFQLALISDNLTHIQEAVQRIIAEVKQVREPLKTGRTPRAGKRRRVTTSSDDSPARVPSSAMSIAERDGLIDSGKLCSVASPALATIAPPSYIAHGSAAKSIVA
jgi:hypothetical protein